MSKVYIPSLEAVPLSDDHFVLFDDALCLEIEWLPEIDFFAFKDMNTATIGNTSYSVPLEFRKRPSTFLDVDCGVDNASDEMDYDAVDSDDDQFEYDQSGSENPDADEDRDNTIVFVGEDNTKGVIFSTLCGFGSRRLEEHVGKLLMDE